MSKKYILLFFIVLNTLVFSQSNTNKLKKEQERLEKNIQQTKNLLEKTKNNTEATLNQLKLIENQVKYREELLQNYDNQIRGTELKIEEKNKQIKDLELKIEDLKTQYKKLIVYAYKKRSDLGKLMFIFSSDSYYEALKRKKYLDKLAEIQRKQKLIIIQHQQLINKEKTSLEKERAYKLTVADKKRDEKDKIEKDKINKASKLELLKSQEQKLLANLKESELKRQEIKRKIDAAIQADIAKQERLAKKKRDKEANKTKTKTNSSNTKGDDNKNEPIIEDKVDVELNSNFVSNKGRLPWPVTSGSITEGYGRNPHPTIPSIYTNNNGVDISTVKGAQVRAVFDGEVTTVLNITGAGKTVIIRHGNYRTVYSNLKEVYVSMGDKVDTKQTIGSLISSDEKSLSVLHFEVRQDVNAMNPSIWLSK